MDTLSQLLDDIHLRGAEFLLTDVSAPWALRLNTAGLAAFHIVISGSAWLRIPDREAIRLSPGDMVMLPTGAAHQLQSMEDHSDVTHDLLTHIAGSAERKVSLHGDDPTAPVTSLLSGYFRFDIEMAKPLVRALPDAIHVEGDNGKAPAWLEIGLQFVANELAVVRPAQQALVNRMADVIFIECMRHVIEGLNTDSDSWLRALRDPSLSAALTAMHVVPEKDWTVPLLAEKACLSRSAFADRFRKVMGQTPLAYLTDHRMRLARWQLGHTKLPVFSIAEAVGYGSDTAFSQAFKRAVGKTPSEYRREQTLRAGSDAGAESSDAGN